MNKKYMIFEEGMDPVEQCRRHHIMMKHDLGED